MKPDARSSSTPAAAGSSTRPRSPPPCTTAASPPPRSTSPTPSRCRPTTRCCDAPNLLVVPHIGSATHAARARMADMAVDNLLAGLAGEPLPHPRRPGSSPPCASPSSTSAPTRPACSSPTSTRHGASTELERRTTVTRLGQGVDHTGALAPRGDASASTRRWTSTARRSTRTTCDDARSRVLTSAVRDAANGAAFTARVRERYGLDARTITGDEEARLTFLGATSDRAAGRRRRRLRRHRHRRRLDRVRRRHAAPSVDFHVSTQAGVVRQTERHLRARPAARPRSCSAAAEARARSSTPPARRVRARVSARRSPSPAPPPPCAAIAQELEPYDPARVHGYRLAARAARDAARAPGRHDRRRSAARSRACTPTARPTIVAGVDPAARGACAPSGSTRSRSPSTTSCAGAALLGDGTGEG